LLFSKIIIVCPDDVETPAAAEEVAPPRGEFTLEDDDDTCGAYC